MQETVLVTGANRGIGLELAAQVARSGRAVIGTARRPEAAAALAALAGARVLAMDVTDSAGVAAAAGTVAGPIDVLICNAGAYRGRGGPEDPDYTAQAWAEVMAINVTGVFLTVRAFLPHLARGTRPRIAVITSAMGSSARAPGGSYAYRASKAAATNLARNLAADLKPRGIAVGAYHPGWVRTEMGGQGADIDVATSAEGLLARIDALSLATTGAVEDYRGAALSF